MSEGREGQMTPLKEREGIYPSSIATLWALGGLNDTTYTGEGDLLYSVSPFKH